MSNMVIQTNMLSLNAHRNMGITGTAQARASARLSSGFRINTAADDAAGLGISEKMRGQIRGLDQASRNAQDGISLIQTAEGAMQTVNDIVIRIRELVVQSANDTNVHEDANPAQSDRARIQDEINQLLDEIDQIAYRTEFNTRTLLNGDWAAGGAPISAAQRIAFQDLLQDATFALQVDTLNAARDSQTNIQTMQALLADERAFLENALDEINSLTSTSAMNTWLGSLAGAVSSFIDRQTAANPQGDVSAEAQVEHVNALARAHFGFSSDFDMFDVATDATVAGIDWNALTNDNWAAQSADFADVGELRDAMIQNRALAANGGNWGTAVGNWGMTDVGTFASGTAALEVAAGGDSVDTIGDGTDYTFAGTSGVAARIAAIVTLQADAVDQLDAARVDEAAQLRLLNTTIRNDDVLRESFSDFDELMAAYEGTPGRALWFHIGANENQGVRLHIENVSVDALGLSHMRTATAGNILLGGSVQQANDTGFSGVMIEGGEDLGSSETGFLTSLDEALAVVTSQRSILGAMQNRLEFSIQNLDIASENLQAANSRIRDADMAREMMRFTQTNVLQQAAISMLAQANMAPQNILQLLR